MRHATEKLSFWLFAALLSCVPTLAQEGPMKLLTPDVGWVLGGGGLYWTTDGGSHWMNITPTVSLPRENVAAVFFKDTATGWVVLSSWDKASDNWRFDLAATVDSGTSWSLAPLAYPDLPSWLQDTIGGPAGMYFVDSLHGWIDMGFAGNSRPGKLLATEDGGRTWKWVNNPGVAGPIRFVTAQDGWVAGGMDPKLYVTHDGCKSWQEVALKPPPQVGAATYPTYSLPVFDSSRRGFLPVNYSGGRGTPSKLVVYAADDLGRTWRLDRVLAESERTSVGQIVPLAIADSVLVVSTGSSPTSVSVAGVPLTGEAGASVVASPIGVLALSFADSTHGWILTAYGKLLSTADSGRTWAEVTPWRQTKPGRISEAPGPPGGAAVGGPATSISIAPEATASGGGGGGSSTHTSLHLGFDTSYVMLSDKMQTWWNFSPYYDTIVYLPGSSNRGVDPNLDSTWVTDVTGAKQGWGLIPTWFGVQPPCTFCTNCKVLFSSDPNQDGQTEAGKAESAAKSLGLTTTVIYKNIENYDTTNATCSAAVTAYVSGWVFKLHSDGYSAGVYGNPAPAQNDFSQASPLPDEVWIAKYDSRATIWGLGNLIDGYWPSNQRIHQYYAGSAPNYTGVTETWGGYAYNMDRDIESAPVAGAQGTKTLTFSSSSFNTISDGADGLNDAGGDLSSGVQDQIVGNVGNAGFLDTNGPPFTQISCQGANQTVVEDINNAGHIVGEYSTSTSNVENGFIYIAGSCNSFNYNNNPNLATWAFGVNDDDQIVGQYRDASNYYHGYFYNYNAGTWASFDYAGVASGTALAGINGQEQIVGQYPDSSSNYHSFIWNLGSDSTVVPIPDHTGASETRAEKINGSGWVVGTYIDSKGTHTFLYNGSFSPFPNDPNACANCTFGYGINNLGRVAGAYETNPTTAYGFWAIPAH